MLETYSEYIHLFLSKKGLSNRPCPGEHHFVSAYLVPKLFSINQRIPDYINPDGTKGILGMSFTTKTMNISLALK